MTTLNEWQATCSPELQARVGQLNALFGHMVASTCPVAIDDEEGGAGKEELDCDWMICTRPLMPILNMAGLPNKCK